MNNLNLLLVEDSPADVFLIKEFLEEDKTYDYCIFEAQTLAAAREELAGNHIDVVLLDLSLPDSSGLDTVRSLLTDYPQMVIIVLTGNKDQQMALQIVRFGAQDYLEKDQITPALLQRAIAYSIERKKAAMEKTMLFTDLGNALEQLKALQAVLPICISCRNVRDDEGKWQPVEVYIKSHENREGGGIICPQCRKELDAGLTNS